MAERPNDGKVFSLDPSSILNSSEDVIESFDDLFRTSSCNHHNMNKMVHQFMPMAQLQLTFFLSYQFIMSELETY